MLAAAAALLALRIELITMGPGAHAYERFGHAALRVIDERGDRVYNYGVGDFEEPTFPLRFLRGEARFRSESRSWARTLRGYRRDDRDIWRQPLALPDGAARALRARLEQDASSLAYEYDYFLDNCSTRIRDLLDEASGGALRARTAHAPTEHSYREWARRHVVGLPHALLAAELNGRPFDRRPTVWGLMFLPDHLRDEVTRTPAAPGETRMLAAAPERVYRRRAAWPLHGRPDAMRLAFWAAGAAAFALGAAAWRGSVRAAGGAMVLLGAVSGGLGTVLLVGAALSPSPYLRHNENLLALLPSDLFLLVAGVALFLRGRPRWAGALAGYLKLRVQLAAVFLTFRAGGLFVQDNAALLGFVLLGCAPLWLAMRRHAGGRGAADPV